MRNLLTPTALGLSLLLTPALSFAEAAHNGAPLPSQRLAVTNGAAGTEHSLSALPAAHPAAGGAAATANTAAGVGHSLSALPDARPAAGGTAATANTAAGAGHSLSALPDARPAAGGATTANTAAGAGHSLSALPDARPAAGGAATANTATGSGHRLSAQPAAGNRAGTLGATEPERAATAKAKETNVIPAAEAAKLVGKPVRNRDGQQLGTLDKVITGPNGQVEKLVISHGGFFGLFQSQSEISWQFAKPEIKGNQLILAISPEQVASAPSYNAAGH